MSSDRRIDVYLMSPIKQFIFAKYSSVAEQKASLNKYVRGDQAMQWQVSNLPLKRSVPPWQQAAWLV